MKIKVLTLAVSAAFATASQGAPSGESTITLGEVTVRTAQGGPLLTRNILTSVDVLASDKIEDKQVMNSWELLGQMPGIQLTETRDRKSVV